jgi:hypothetical protein
MLIYRLVSRKQTSGGKIPESYSYFRWADQFDSGNAMVKEVCLKK